MEIRFIEDDTLYMGSQIIEDSLALSIQISYPDVGDVLSIIELIENGVTIDSWNPTKTSFCISTKPLWTEPLARRSQSNIGLYFRCKAGSFNSN